MQIVRGTVRVIRYLWAAPCSVLGLMLAVVAFLTGASVRRYRGTLEVTGGRFGSWISRLPSPLRFYAVTLGHVIVGVSHDLLIAHREHERVHVRQYERWGILFIPLYGIASLLQYFYGRDPYHGNRFEREACSRNAKLK